MIHHVHVGMLSARTRNDKGMGGKELPCGVARNQRFWQKQLSFFPETLIFLF